MGYVLNAFELILLIAAPFAAAVLTEAVYQRKTGTDRKMITTVKTAMVGVFAAISGILMIVLEVPLIFIAPEFYKLDFSEVPVMILTFAYGPLAGVFCEMLKIIIKLMFKGTGSNFVGELANFLIGCSYVLPAGAVYLADRTKKGAVAACIAGTLVMTAVSGAANILLLLPYYAQFMPLEKIIAMGAQIWPAVDSVGMLVLICVLPFNLIKGILITLITMLIYKPLRKVIRFEKTSPRNAAGKDMK